MCVMSTTLVVQYRRMIRCFKIQIFCVGACADLMLALRKYRYAKSINCLAIALVKVFCHPKLFVSFSVHHNNMHGETRKKNTTLFQDACLICRIKTALAFSSYNMENIKHNNADKYSIKGY